MEGEARRRALAVGGTIGGITLMIVAVFASFFIAARPDPDALAEDDHPCLDSLAVMQPRVLGAFTRGNAIPKCGTKTTPADCWAEADVTSSMVASALASGLDIRVEQTREGFELRCRADLDEDGDRALYEANDRTTGVRITAYGVR
ncbi:MAG: hypothetical protein GY898_19870 [Proteobacteria bacterium]|nr:hypothetical protein [Pseudomonadota bacterium]